MRYSKLIIIISVIQEDIESYVSLHHAPAKITSKLKYMLVSHTDIVFNHPKVLKMHSCAHTF